MDKWLKQFRDNLARRPEPAFEAQDWQDMQRRLDRQDDKKPPVVAWVLLPWLLLLLSSGLNVFFYTTRQAPRENAKQADARTDSIVRTRIVYRTDTVYKTRIIKEKSALPASLNVARNELYAGHLSFTKSAVAINDTATDSPRGANTPAVTGDTTSLDFLAAPLPPISHVQPEIFRKSTPPFAVAEPATIKRKKTLRQHLYKARPDAFRLGISGGTAMPFSKNLSRQSGYLLGLQAEIDYAAWRVWADAHYYNTRFEANRMDEAIGVPPVAPPSDDFEFNKAEIPQPFMQYSIGLQYMFNHTRRFKPMLGIGYGLRVVMPYEIVYEFGNKALGIEWTIDQRISPAKKTGSMALFRTGLEYEFGKRWHGGLLTQYAIPLPGSKTNATRMLDLRLQWMYRF
ncbi:MAG: hypothetical protein KDC61_10290 [Saprospiraceae bacterium]|nr:hypothetical protein [Saprospiraceae bacterium]MCB9352971.1 hypothetical protein [Lewinellaceae bacterium]